MSRMTWERGKAHDTRERYSDWPLSPELQPGRKPSEDIKDSRAQANVVESLTRCPGTVGEKL